MATKIRNRRPFFRRKRRPADGEDYDTPYQRRRIPVTKMKKGIFILPSLLTLMGIFFSFYAIICAIEGRFFLSAALIIVSAFFDGIDGRVARLTKTTTRFGLELDSLADVISFGVAPAILLFRWGLMPYDRIGWVTAFVFVACGALRLARFNVQSGTIDPKRFNGLPIPAAAVMVASTVMFFSKLSLNPEHYTTSLLIMSYVISFLMVSSVKFHGFKDLTLIKEKPFSSTVAFVLVLALIAVSPSVVPFFLCLGYVISGPILTVVLYLRNRKRQEEQREESAVSASTTPSS